MRRARPGSSWVLKSLVELVVPRIVTCVRGPARLAGLLGVLALALPVPSTVCIGYQRHRHEDGLPTSQQACLLPPLHACWTSVAVRMTYILA